MDGAHWLVSDDQLLQSLLHLTQEVLDFQAHHPEQHDQQSMNQILSELLVADLTVSVHEPFAPTSAVERAAHACFSSPTSPHAPPSHSHFHP